MLALELLVAMNYAPAALPPPAADLAERVERRLQDLEDKVARQGPSAELLGL